jgi:hypothetical protein
VSSQKTAPGSKKQKVAVSSRISGQQLAEPTMQNSERPIYKMQMCEETSLKLKNMLRVKKNRVHTHTCKIHGKHHDPFDLQEKCTRMHFYDLISSQIMKSIMILPDNRSHDS